MSLSDSETMCEPPVTLRVFPVILTRSVSRSDAGGPIGGGARGSQSGM
jgi:hypothetical protein